MIHLSTLVGSLVCLACAIASGWLLYKACAHYIQELKDNVEHARRQGYNLGRDQGEDVGVKRGYRLAMKHCANSVAGRPPSQEEIP